MNTTKERTGNIEGQTEIRTYKYDSHVKPRLKDIYEWVKQGYTDYSIAEQLGAAYVEMIPGYRCKLRVNTYV